MSEIKQVNFENTRFVTYKMLKVRHSIFLKVNPCHIFYTCLPKRLELSIIVFIKLGIISLPTKFVPAVKAVNS